MNKLNIRVLVDKFKALSKENLLLLLFSAPFNFAIYYLARYLAKARYHYCLLTPIDEMIPLIPWTIIFYWGCYVVWVINYCLCVICDENQSGEFIKTHYIGETICFIIMIIFPTIMPRPEILGTDFFSRMVNVQYTIDAADNLFPSIHCFVSYLCWIGVRNNPNIPKWYQNTSFVLAILVFISTLTVKQHVILDVFASVIVAQIAYKISAYLSSRKKLSHISIIKRGCPKPKELG